MRYWGLGVTFCDAENNQFLSLGGAAWKTKRERDRNFAMIPVSITDSPFIVDVENDDGIIDDRMITKETVEGLIGRPVSQLIEESRQRELKG